MVGRLRRAALPVLLAAALATTALGAAACQRPGNRGNPAAATQPPTPAAVSIGAGELGAAGVTVVPDERSATGAPGYVITRVQADRMAAGASILGADLDAVSPMPAGAPPMSYLVAAWVAKGTSPSAAAARKAMGTQNWSAAPRLAFPTAVPAMFVAELAHALAATPDRFAAGPDRFAAGPLPRTALTADGPCSTVTQFLAGAIKGLFDALKLNRKSGGSFWNDLIAGLAAVWDYAVDIARGIVNAVYTALTEPVFAILRTAAGALGVATMIATYLSDQKLVVTLAPNQLYRYAVGSEPDIRGQFIARSTNLTDSWPPAIADCAKAVNRPLPELNKPGSRSTWQLLDDPNQAGVIVPGPLTGVVLGDRTARLDFATNRESEETARGVQDSALPIVTVQVEQKPVTEFLNWAQDEAGNLLNAAANLIPDPTLRQLAQAKLHEIVDPAVDRLKAEIAGTVGGVYTLKGSSHVIVTFHRPPQTPTPTPTPSAQPADFCGGYRAVFAWSLPHHVGGGISPSWEEWGGELARRFTKLLPQAGSHAADLNVMIHVYTLISRSANGGVLGGTMADEGFLAAAGRLQAYCKTPSLLP